MNYLISAEAGAGHSCQLAVALRKYIELESIYITPSAFKLDFIDPSGKVRGEFPDRGDTIIIVSAYAYRVAIERKGQDYFNNFKRVIIILTDSIFMRDSVELNEKFKNFDVFATNCKMQYRVGFPTKVYYQPFDLSAYKHDKNKKLTLGHSPFCNERMHDKGTDQILEIFKRSGCDYDVVSGQTPWADCMVRKSKCHIFVDQISHARGFWNTPDDWMGGIGKSGLEAMLLGCLVITRLNKVDYDIPAPPVVVCNKENIEELLTYYINISSARNSVITQQYQWAEKYLDPDFCAKRILYEVF